MPQLDDTQSRIGVIAVASRKLAAYIDQDPLHRSVSGGLFQDIVTFGLALLSGGRWMTEAEILKAIPRSGRSFPRSASTIPSA